MAKERFVYSLGRSNSLIFPLPYIRGRKRIEKRIEKGKKENAKKVNKSTVNSSTRHFANLRNCRKVLWYRGAAKMVAPLLLYLRWGL